jgi:hypothetical protein
VWFLFLKKKLIFFIFIFIDNNFVFTETLAIFGNFFKNIMNHVVVTGIRDTGIPYFFPNSKDNLEFYRAMHLKGNMLRHDFSDSAFFSERCFRY